MNFKLLVALLLLLFVVGCVPLEVPSEWKDTEEIIHEAVPSLIGFDEGVIFKVGDSVHVFEKEVKLESFVENDHFTMSVNGVKRDIYETREAELMQGLRIVATQMRFEPANENTYVILQIDELELGKDEYVLYYDKKMNFGDKVVRLVDVTSHDPRVIKISVDSQYSGFIIEGESEIVDGLRITNIESHPRRITSEKHALIAIESIF